MRTFTSTAPMLWRDSQRRWEMPAGTRVMEADTKAVPDDIRATVRRLKDSGETAVTCWIRWPGEQPYVAAVELRMLKLMEVASVG